ncbi:MAG: hypothetical protein QY326_07820 [Bdellovibrionota bacterium]|nr:MAG: hypothetical protein QY326_07820 [Bdellovibrionota bacterium]
MRSSRSADSASSSPIPLAGHESELPSASRINLHPFSASYLLSHLEQRVLPEIANLASFLHHAQLQDAPSWATSEKEWSDEVIQMHDSLAAVNAGCIACRSLVHSVVTDVMVRPPSNDAQKSTRNRDAASGYSEDQGTLTAIPGSLNDLTRQQYNQLLNYLTTLPELVETIIRRVKLDYARGAVTARELTTRGERIASQLEDTIEVLNRALIRRALHWEVSKEPQNVQGQSKGKRRRLLSETKAEEGVAAPKHDPIPSPVGPRNIVPTERPKETLLATSSFPKRQATRQSNEPQTRMGKAAVRSDVGRPALNGKQLRALSTGEVARPPAAFRPARRIAISPENQADTRPAAIPKEVKAPVLSPSEWARLFAVKEPWCELRRAVTMDGSKGDELAPADMRTRLREVGQQLQKLKAGSIADVNRLTVICASVEILCAQLTVKGISNQDLSKLGELLVATESIVLPGRSTVLVSHGERPPER